MHYFRHRITRTLNRDNIVSGGVSMGQKDGIAGKFQIPTNRTGNFSILPFLISKSLRRFHIINKKKSKSTLLKNRSDASRNDVGMELFHIHFFFF